jgi:ABC-type Fe3+/spermidine/putrescine transport system ATPase subunit
MVLDRDILLLDEPLAALDAQLRKDMCLELKHLQEKVGITFIHVTHNQEEAMTVADRIAVIADGELVEEGRAGDIYRAPERRFTASFVGENNMLAGTVVELLAGETVVVRVADGQTVQADRRGLAVGPGDAVDLSIRSELLRVVPGSSAAEMADGHSLAGRFRESVYMGLVTTHLVTLASGQDMMVRVISDGAEAPPAPGAPVRLDWDPGALRLHTS